MPTEEPLPASNVTLSPCHLVTLSPCHLPEVVLVCGAGAAGSPAALAAARAGAPVCLIEATAGPGGTVANCLIHTLGGLYDSTGEFLHDGLVAELLHALSQEGSATRRRLGRTWVLSVC